MAYMSQEGYDKMVAELRHMETVDRPAASEAIAEARDKGDLSENSEYDAAKEAQAMLEMKINKLKAALASAVWPACTGLKAPPKIPTLLI